MLVNGVVQNLTELFPYRGHDGSLPRQLYRSFVNGERKLTNATDGFIFLDARSIYLGAVRVNREIR